MLVHDAAFEIDHRQPAMSQPHVPITKAPRPLSPPVWSTAEDRREHGLEQLERVLGLNEADEATHDGSTLVKADALGDRIGPAIGRLEKRSDQHLGQQPQTEKLQAAHQRDNGSTQQKPRSSFGGDLETEPEPQRPRGGAQSQRMVNG